MKKLPALAFVLLIILSLSTIALAQLQRLGIQPTVRVEPTVAGIRAGKDEVLEAAISFLNAARKK